MNIVKFDVNPHYFVNELESILGRVVEFYDEDVTADSIELVIYDNDDDFDGRTLILEVRGRWLHAKINIPPHLTKLDVEAAIIGLNDNRQSWWVTDLWFTRTLGPLDNIENEEQLAALVADALKEN